MYLSFIENELGYVMLDDVLIVSYSCDVTCLGASTAINGTFIVYF